MDRPGHQSPARPPPGAVETQTLVAALSGSRPPGTASLTCVVQGVIGSEGPGVSQGHPPLSGLWSGLTAVALGPTNGPIKTGAGSPRRLRVGTV